MRCLLICYDNSSKISTFPLGTAYIAAYLKEAGCYVEILEQNVNHYPDSYITDFLNKRDFDWVGMGIISGYYQYKRLKEISKAINKSKNRKKFQYVLGGHGVQIESKYWMNLTGADDIYFGKGEIGLYETYGWTLPKEEVYPAWDLFSIEHYVIDSFPGFDRTDRMMTMVSGWGCPYSCNFCYRMIKGFEPRSTESIISEIKTLQMKYNITAIDFCDELLMSSEKRTIEISKALRKRNIHWTCNGRLNFASKEVLKVMKDSGCVWINYGIESLDDKMLKVMNKHLTVKQITEGVENTIEVGIKPCLNIIFGNIGETIDILWKGVNFIKKYNDGSQLRTIRFCTPYPGSPLYDYCIEKGLLKGIKDFYKKHTNSDLMTVNLTSHTDKECYEALKTANKELIYDYYTKNKHIALDQCNDFYDNKDITFRGWRSV